MRNRAIRVAESGLLGLVLLALTSVAAQAAIVVPDASTQGLWYFDDTPGNTAADSSGKGNHGSLNAVGGTPTWLTGGDCVSGGCLDFIASQSDAVDVPDHNSLSVTNQFTMAAWIYPTGNGNGTGGGGGVLINKELEYEFARWENGTIQWAINNSNPGWAWEDTGYVAPLNEWTHVAIVYDGAVANTIKTYINGDLEHTFSGASGNIANTTAGVRIGGRGPCCIQFFDGRIDEPVIYNRALNDAEVLAIATVPEPATWMLLLFGLMTVGPVCRMGPWRRR